MFDTSNEKSENETNVYVFRKPNKREQTQANKRQGDKVRYSKDSTGQSANKKNLNAFHKSNECSIYQCSICYEAWPLSSNRNRDKYNCLRCATDKGQPKKFSRENKMVPSPVPPELQGLTLIEEMFIARVLPLIHLYVKPGGQRRYSGHCINLPQNVSELVQTLPRYPTELSIIIVEVNGKDNNHKDLFVRRQNVAKALQWLITNNPHYKDIIVNQDSLCSLPDNRTPNELPSG